MKYLKIIGLLFIIGIYSSCNNDDDDHSEFNETYTEISPVKNRTLIKFTSSTSLTIIKPENSIDKFTYEITEDQILLTHESQNQPNSLGFERISDSEFKIQNLYGDIPENDISYMTFKK